MKKRYSALAIILMLFTAFSGNSQLCDVPAYQPSFAQELIPEFPSNFNIYYKVESGVSRPYYSPKCGTNEIELLYNTTKGSLQLQMYLEVFKTTYNCSGTITGTTLIQTTPTVTYGSGSGNIQVQIDNIPSGENAYYQVVAHRRTKFIWWGTWGHETSNNVRFIIPDNNPTPIGSFSTVTSTETRTSTGTGWSVDVDILDCINPTLDASATFCETSWLYQIAEFDLNSWTSTNVYSSGWINGSAGSVNLDAVYPAGIQKNQLYIVTLVAGPGWNPIYYWFELKDAVASGSFPNSTLVGEAVHSKHGGTLYYLLNQVCTPAGNFNTTGTQCADKYRFTVQAVNATYSPVGSIYTTGWVTGQPPATYDLTTVTGSSFVTGQRYKVTYEVGDPVQLKTYYFMPVTCIDNGDVVMRTSDESTVKARVYPNPNNGIFNVEMDNDENYEIAVYDLTGHLILSQSDAKGVQQIDLSDKEAGVYLVKTSQNSQVKTHRVVIK